jgi:hypothetical protein
MCIPKIDYRRTARTAFYAVVTAGLTTLIAWLTTIALVRYELEQWVRYDFNLVCLLFVLLVPVFWRLTR